MDRCIAHAARKVPHLENRRYRGKPSQSCGFHQAAPLVAGLEEMISEEVVRRKRPRVPGAPRSRKAIMARLRSPPAIAADTLSTRNGSGEGANHADALTARTSSQGKDPWKRRRPRETVADLGKGHGDIAADGWPFPERVRRGWAIAREQRILQHSDHLDRR